MTAQPRGEVSALAPGLVSSQQIKITGLKVSKLNLKRVIVCFIRAFETVLMFYF